jgi:hypothetical protein
MSRHRSSGSYGHTIKATSHRDEFVIAWTVDRYYAGSRLRHPDRKQRDTDRKGAEKFAKKWGVPMPAEPTT